VTWVAGNEEGVGNGGKCDGDKGDGNGDNIGNGDGVEGGM